MIAAGNVDPVGAASPLERRLVEAFVTVVVPLHMLLPTAGGWLMVLAALRGLVTIVRRPAFDALDRLYFVACALIPGAYLLNMALTGWAPSWLHRPAHLLITGGLVFLWIGRVGLRERAFFRAVVLASFTVLGIALFDVLVNGSVRVFGWRQQWNAVPFGNFSLLLGFLSFAGCIGAMFDGMRDRWRVTIGLAATVAGIHASILAGTRGGWLAIPILIGVTLWAALRAYRRRVFASRYFLPALVAMPVFAVAALWLSDTAQQRIDIAFEDIEALVQGAPARAAVDPSIGLRLEMWKWGLEKAAERPLTGVGLAHFSEARQQAVQSGRMPATFGALANLHNELISSLAIGGIPTALAVVAFWILMGSWFVRRIGHGDSFFFATSGLLVVVGTGVFSMTEGLFGTSAGTKALAILLAIPAGALRHRATIPASDGAVGAPDAPLRQRQPVTAGDASAFSTALADRRPRTLVVHHRSGIGDLVWHVPYLRAIAATSRGGRVTLMARPSCRAPDLLGAEPAIDAVIEYDYRPRRNESRRGRDSGLRGFLRTAALVRSRDFDRVYIFSSRTRYALLAWWAGIPQRAGFGFSLAQRMALNLGPCIRPHRGEGSWVYPEATEFARAHGFVDGPLLPRLAVPSALLAQAARTFAQLPVPRVALLIGTSEPRKDWGAANFTRLAQALLDRGFGVLVLGGPAEAEVADRILADIGQRPGAVAICRASVLQSAAALKCCDLCIGNDTGALNLAAAVGVRCLGLFGATRALKHDPGIEAIEASSMASIVLDDVLRRVDAIEGFGASEREAAMEPGGSSA
ncbi:MAG: O-antigen ligase family protein [Burkholderiaceae bacterium]|nr:O-antigen ligase family protein [Burkholderiaceae bacterium]